MAEPNLCRYCPFVRTCPHKCRYRNGNPQPRLTDYLERSDDDE